MLMFSMYCYYYYVNSCDRTCEGWVYSESFSAARLHLHHSYVIGYQGIVMHVCCMCVCARVRVCVIKYCELLYCIVLCGKPYTKDFKFSIDLKCCYMLLNNRSLPT